MKLSGYSVQSAVLACGWGSPYACPECRYFSQLPLQLWIINGFNEDAQLSAIIYLEHLRVNSQINYWTRTGLE